MPIDWTKPFKRGSHTSLGWLPPSDPVYSGGLMISGRRLSERLESSPKKATDEDKGPKGKPKGKQKK